MLVFTQRLQPNLNAVVNFTLALTAEERTRSRHRFDQDGQTVFLRLPRGTVLRDRDLLQAEFDSVLVRVVAKPELIFCICQLSASCCKVTNIL